MDIKQVEKIKKLATIAMFSDDDLVDMLVLKGANAIEVVHGIPFRTSIDLDFSIQNEFTKPEFKIIKEKIKRTLKGTFQTEDYEIFDITFDEKPEKITPEMAEFWGGYSVEFKIIESIRYKTLANKLDALRRNSIVVGPKQKRKFRIEISKFEYCVPKLRSELEGYTIYVYTPEMIVIEKIRAIFQQMPEYAEIVTQPSPSPRARDFFDIYTLLEHFKTDLTSSENIDLLKNIFAAKKVPIEFIGKIHKYREYHRPDFIAVKDTVKTSIELRDFDFYFDYVTQKCKALQPLWEI